LLNGNWEYDDDPNALFETDALHDLFSNPVSGEGRIATSPATRQD
jgi:hypothetical protein